MRAAELSKRHRGVEGSRVPAMGSQGRKKQILVGGRGKIRGVFLEGTDELDPKG